MGLCFPKIPLPSEVQLSSPFPQRPELPVGCGSVPIGLQGGERAETPCWGLPAFSTLLPPPLTLGVGKYVPRLEFFQGVWLGERGHPASH